MSGSENHYPSFHCLLLKIACLRLFVCGFVLGFIARRVLNMAFRLHTGFNARVHVYLILCVRLTNADNGGMSI